ncbi:MAG: YigZ family protein [Anaerolineales bacterium]|nr:YigZ family protein [Anaerolineales bacterium]
MSDTYLLPAEEVRRELTVSNSRFIASLAPVSRADEAKAFVARIRKEFADATHNVPAYIIGGGNSITEYCSDDGEPSGTAGRPALAVLHGSGLGDVAVVVTRYFGGALLGKGGLVRAYTNATKLVVEAVPRARRIPVHLALLALPYPFLERVRLLVARHNGEITDENFAADVIMTLRFPVEEFPAFQVALREISSGSLQGEVIETTEMLIKVDDR